MLCWLHTCVSFHTFNMIWAVVIRQFGIHALSIILCHSCLTYMWSFIQLAHSMLNLSHMWVVFIQLTCSVLLWSHMCIFLQLTCSVLWWSDVWIFIRLADYFLRCLYKTQNMHLQIYSTTPNCFGRLAIWQASFRNSTTTNCFGSLEIWQAPFRKKKLDSHKSLQVLSQIFPTVLLILCYKSLQVYCIQLYYWHYGEVGVALWEHGHMYSYICPNFLWWVHMWVLILLVCPVMWWSHIWVFIQ